MELLAISLKNLDFCEIRDAEVECGLILDAEHIFQNTFSEEINISPAKVGFLVLLIIIICLTNNGFL